MKKHNYKFNLHCETCWDKCIKGINKYYNSKQYIEDERRRYEMIEKLNKPLLDLLNNQTMKIKWECDFCSKDLESKKKLIKHLLEELDEMHSNLEIVMEQIEYLGVENPYD